MQRRTVFRGRTLPYLLVLPQLAVTAVFFLWPAAQAFHQSLLIEDPFGIGTQFVWLENYKTVLDDPGYVTAITVTIIFSVSVMLVALGTGLLLAVLVDGIRRGASAYHAALLSPYAIAPVVAGVLWLFMLNPTIGILAYGLDRIGIDWNPLRNGQDALILVTIAASWKQISYNFIFFLAGLQAIPRSLVEAAAIDGAGPVRRFWTVVFPLLSPTSFFLMVVNLAYAFFETFPIIDAVTSGGPGRATSTLVYKVYRDGFIALDLGGSAAQSVILMMIVGLLTIIQFRYIERRLHY